MLAQRAMSLANPTKVINPESIKAAERELMDLINQRKDWFLSQDGRAPVEVNSGEIDFSTTHGNLIFTCWTEKGSRVWRINGWSWTGDKLLLQVSRRMGAENSTVELVPRASSKAIVASIAAARQARCEKLAALLAQSLVLDSKSQITDSRLRSLPLVKIERADLSPGMRRDQPGRYARIILRLPYERVAATAIVARSDARNVDSLFSSAL